MERKKYPRDERWSELEIRQFDLMIHKVESPLNETRIAGRLEMKRFVEAHGTEKCDAMWNALGYNKGSRT